MELSLRTVHFLSPGGRGGGGGGGGEGRVKESFMKESGKFCGEGTKILPPHPSSG